MLISHAFYSYILFLLSLLLSIQKSICRGHQERYKAFPSIKIWRTSLKIKLELFKPENAGKWPLTKSLVTRTDYSSPLTNVIFSSFNWFKLNTWHNSVPSPRKLSGNHAVPVSWKKTSIFLSIPFPFFFPVYVAGFCSFSSETQNLALWGVETSGERQFSGEQ